MKHPSYPSFVVATAASMNTSSVLFPKPYFVAAPHNSKLCCKLFDKLSIHSRNVFSTLAISDAHSQTLFSRFASTKLNMSEADITRIFKCNPALQRFQSLEKVEQFINLLKRYGCSEVQITNIMRDRPQIISFSAERILEPKIKLLEDFGFEGQPLTKLLTLNPHILRCSLEDDLLPKMEFLKNVFQSQDALVKALLITPRLLSASLEKTLKPSVAFWEGWGFRGTDFSSFVEIHPAVLLRTSLMPAQADLIRKIGVDKESKAFKYILSLVARSRTETLEAKIQNLQNCGLSAEETLQIFRVNSAVFCRSKENISAKMNFVVNNMGLPASCVMEHTFLLLINLERITRPRFLVWQKIKYINDPDLPLLRVLAMSEVNFVNKIIKGYPESKSLLKIYENAIYNASNSRKSSFNETERTRTQKPLQNY